MNSADERQVTTISRLQVHEYFDHYLTDVFPQQMDAIIDGHNQDAEAHEPRLGPLVKTQQQFNRLRWVVVGGGAVIGVVSGVIVRYGPIIIRAIW